MNIITIYRSPRLARFPAPSDMLASDLALELSTSLIQREWRARNDARNDGRMGTGKPRWTLKAV